jgi:hypothetical protein
MIQGFINLKNRRSSQNFYENDGKIGIQRPEWSFFRTPGFISLSIYTVWVFCGIAFYTVYNKFTVATAYFYTLEAGLSIGFCNPSDPDNPSRAFTMVLVFTGSSIVAGAVGAFGMYLTDDKVSMIPVEERDVYVGPDSFHNGENSVINYMRWVWFRFKYRIGWYSYRIHIKLTVLLWIWLFLGVAYGITMEYWDFVTSLYW